MARQTSKDMTNGSPLRLILGFSLPLLMGMIFQQCYNLIDTIIVGQVLGVDRLAAVGSTGSINFMILGFCNGLCSGFALPVAQRFGAKDYEGLRKYIGNASVLAVLFGTVMTIVTSLFCYQILDIMNTPSDIIHFAYEYLVIIFLGIPGMMLYNLLSGFIRSLGDSVTPLIFLIISAFLNVALDLFFLLVLRTDVIGAALATVISQAISGILCLVFIHFKVELLHLKKKHLALHPAYVKSLLSMGLPMGLQYSITAIGSVVLQANVNTLGSLAVASTTAGSKISMFAVCPFDALGSTMATYGGQNVGAGKLNRLSKGMWTSGALGCIYAVFAFVVLYFFSDALLLCFVKASEVVVLQQARQFLLINAAFYISLVFVNVVRFLIQGMGYSGLAVFAGVFEMIARGLVGTFLVPVFGFTAACFASPAAWVLADLFLIPAYYYALHALKKRVSKS